MRRGHKRQRGLRCSIHFICKSIEHNLDTKNSSLLDEEALLSVPIFMSVVPGLREEQALRLLTKAVEDHGAKAEEPVSLAEAMGIIGQIHKELLRLVHWKEHERTSELKKLMRSASMLSGITKFGKKRGHKEQMVDAAVQIQRIYRGGRTRQTASDVFGGVAK